MYKCKFLLPNWDGICDVCGQSPTVPLTGLCGPCTFGESDTVAGDWYVLVYQRCNECDEKCEEIDDE